MSVRVKTEDSAEPANSGAISANNDVYDDDEVVREMEVFLSPELCQQIYLLQYPLQHGEVGAFAEARIKPRHNMIEIDQSLPELPQRHYGLGEQNMSWLTKRTFQSHTIPVETHMCLAKLKEDEASGKLALHMVPLEHISQMRPSFKHIDSDGDEKDDSNDMDKKDEDGKKEAQPLRFKRKESDRATHARKSSYAYKKASEDAEEWQTLQVCDYESMEYQSVMDQVQCPPAARQEHVLASPDPNKATRRQRPKYVESLNYMPLKHDDPSAVPSSITSGEANNNIKAVVTRVTALLKNGWPIPYSVLRARLGGRDFDEAILFRALAVCSVMVRGNFCLHSRFVALPRTLQHVRTFILLLLQTRGSIQRERLQMVFQNSSNNEVSMDKLNVLLNQVAKRTARGWELRVADDLSFVALHPEQSQLHLRYWERQTQSTYFFSLLQKYEDA